MIEEAGLELTVSLPEHRVDLDADPARMSQVFSNLLTNAAKYNKRGGQIWLSAEKEAEQLVVSVRDNGIGIRPEMLSTVFEMFTQVDETERSHGGLGLGLSLVRALVDLHGGTVEARSVGLGQGSEFIVRMPLGGASPVAKKATPTTTPTAKADRTRRILVVDDNRDAAKTLSTMLRIMGNEVCTAHDGLEAIAVCERFRPDLVLLDLGMPKLDGYAAAQQIRQQPWGQHITLVALTGWGQDEDRRKSKEAGFDAHLVKPVAAADLKRILSLDSFTPAGSASLHS